MSLTFSDVTSTGSTSSFNNLCSIVASGSTVTFTESEDGSCDVDHGSITVSGATVSGTVSGVPCAVTASGNTLEFFEDNDGCDTAIGTIVLSPVCL